MKWTMYQKPSAHGTEQGGGNMPMIVEENLKLFDMQRKGVYAESGCASRLLAHEEKEGNDIVCAAVDCRNATENTDINGTLQSKPGGGTSYNLQNVVSERYIVRRLTPTECERLQGYPDGWTGIGEWTDTKGKKHKPADSPRYKALGNSIAIPPWLFVLSRLNEYCEDKTMASLFDGIGGFPLIWEFLNGKGSAVWCSEIEEFPIAVTKLRFPDRSITIIFANEDVDRKEYDSSEAAAKDCSVTVTELLDILNGKEEQRKDFFAAWTEDMP